MTSTRPTIVLYLMGENEFVIDLFRKATGVEQKNVELEVVRAMKFEEPQHDWSQYAGVIVSGSTAMVTENRPFAIKVATQLRHVVETQQVPLLAICFGHQLLASELGGVVDWIGVRQLGTTEVKLNPQSKYDALFSIFGDRLSAVFHVAHRQFVKHLPRNATVLASCDVDAHYALRIGEKAWSVQFHPEMTCGVVRNIITLQRDSLKQDGIDPQARMESVRATDDGVRLLHRFVDLCMHEYKVSRAGDHQPPNMLLQPQSKL